MLPVFNADCRILAKLKYLTVKCEIRLQILNFNLWSSILQLPNMPIYKLLFRTSQHTENVLLYASTSCTSVSTEVDNFFFILLENCTTLTCQYNCSNWIFYWSRGSTLNIFFLLLKREREAEIRSRFRSNFVG